MTASFDALTCPQCGGPLPPQARWRMVKCPFCGAEVTRREAFVRSAPFHAAWLRAQALADAAAPVVRCAGAAYRVLCRLGSGERSEAYLAARVGPLGERVVVKLAHTTSLGTEQAARFAAEGELLKRLQSTAGDGAAYFSQRLPQAIAWGTARDWRGRDVEALVLRHAPGHWGSLADVLDLHPRGIAARHVVWMWRRVLEALGFLHAAGFTHGDLQPAHLLVQPGDHGVMPIGWAHAAQASPLPAYGADAVDRCTEDLRQLAWAMRAMLAGASANDPPPIVGSMPAPLAAVVRAASEDRAWCAARGAHGIDRALVDAAARSFGPPRFVPFEPERAGAGA